MNRSFDSTIILGLVSHTVVIHPIHPYNSIQSKPQIWKAKGALLLHLEELPNNGWREKLYSRYLYESISFCGRFNVSYRINEYSEYFKDIRDGIVDWLEWDVRLYRFQEWHDFLGDKAFFLHVIEEAPIKLVNVYNCSKARAALGQRQTDISESLQGFTTSAWGGTFIILFLVALVIKVHLIINKVNKQAPKGSSVWTVFTYAINQASMVDINWVSRLLSFIMYLFSFFVVINFFCNIIKSDKIAPYQPKVYESFNDLVEAENLEILSKYWALNKKLKRSGTKADIISKYQIFSPRVLEKLEKDRVFVSIRSNLRTQRKYLCDILLRSGRIEDICFYIPKTDILDSRGPVGFLASVNMRRKPIFTKYMQYFQRNIDMGLRFYQRWHAYDQHIIMTPKKVSCFTDNLIIHDPDYEPFAIANYKNALAALLVPLSLAIVFLILEKLGIEFQGPKKVRRKRNKIRKKPGLIAM